MSKQKIKLVLSGSGLLYPLHAGAVARLVEDFEIDAIAGVSGGSIIGALYASGYSPEQVKEIVLSTMPGDNTSLIDWSLNPLWSWGIIKGNKFLKLFRKFLPPTFVETQIPLFVGTVDIDRQEEVVFSSVATPEADLALAVRASMSVPFAFTPVRIQGSRYVDGGVSASFPLDIFGEGQNVIGLKVGTSNVGEGFPRNLWDYAKANLSMIMEASNKEHIKDALYARFIELETMSSNTNLFMKKAEALELYEQGYWMTDSWLLSQS